MKRSNALIRLLVIAYLCTLPLHWFGNDEYIDGVTGLSYLVNDPAVLIGAVLLVTAAVCAFCLHAGRRAAK